MKLAKNFYDLSSSGALNALPNTDLNKTFIEFENLWKNTN